MNWKHIAFSLLIFLLLIVLATGCAQVNQQTGTPGTDGVAGFGSGFWHGLILPVAFVISLFDNGVGIYEIHNSGNWYNFGYVLGAWVVFVVIMAPKHSRGYGGK
ncbi:MAG: hypothetical protein ACYCW5_04300 [Thermoleophilia bacterium]